MTERDTKRQSHEDERVTLECKHAKDAVTNSVRGTYSAFEILTMM